MGLTISRFPYLASSRTIGLSGLTRNQAITPITADIAETAIPAYHPNFVAIQAVPTGATIPPILPHEFIQPDTDPLYFPPISKQDAHEAVKVNPSDPSDRVSQTTFCVGAEVMDAMYNVTQQVIKPKEPNNVRARCFDNPALTITLPRLASRRSRKRDHPLQCCQVTFLQILTSAPVEARPRHRMTWAATLPRSSNSNWLESPAARLRRRKSVQGGVCS
jgi:hypothetical protein